MLRTDTGRTIGIILTAALLAGAAVVLLNTGAVSVQAAPTCDDGQGGGGGGTPSPSGSASPSPSSTGGGLPTIPPIIPSSTPSSSPTASPTATDGPPAGATTTCESKITIAYDPPGPQEGARAGFHGAVTSGKATCERARNVIVKKDARRDKTIGTTTTNRKGKWKLPVQKANGKYYAKTPARRIVANDGSETICAKAKSKTIRV